MKKKGEEEAAKTQYNRAVKNGTIAVSAGLPTHEYSCVGNLKRGYTSC